MLPGDNGDGKSVLGNLESLFNIISQEKSNFTKRFHLYALKILYFFLIQCWELVGFIVFLDFLN